MITDIKHHHKQSVSGRRHYGVSWTEDGISRVKWFKRMKDRDNFVKDLAADRSVNSQDIGKGVI